ncbi:hypothetical protein OJAV_G00108940 [Oryzias javanicus]|uniref:Uncharacterized protein n=1 Tax=Oryzias javanicus TaxID=123683 RepID=A0A3S2UAH0_ORYJA|nr:hypothetical protein OJAV_G00108940 [Oryzias javanicus]
MAREHPIFRRASNGTLLLKASDEARALGTPKETHRANPTLVLSRWKIQFGKYQDKTFHWLLENDMGYAINLVSSHQKERERTGSQSPLMANKDGLIRYSSAYPDFVEAVRFHQAFEEARVRSLQPGQEGQALVGFGDFKSETLQSLYESEDPKKIRFTAFVSGRRSLSVVEMQAKVKKLVGKPAFPASSTPASSSTTSEEPTDEELVSAVVDMESSNVQAPLSAPGTPPPPDDDDVADTEEQPAPVDVPPPASAGDAELLPESWRAALTAEQQRPFGSERRPCKLA